MLPLGSDEAMNARVRRASHSARVPRWTGRPACSSAAPTASRSSGIDQFEPDRLVRGIALEIHQRMVARVAAHLGLVAAEVGGVAFARDQLQPDDVGGEADRAIQVLRAEAGIADVVQVDHRCFLLDSSVIPQSQRCQCRLRPRAGAGVPVRPDARRRRRRRRRSDRHHDAAHVLGIAPELVFVGVRQPHGFGQQMDPVHDADRAAALQRHGLAVTGVEDRRQRVGADLFHGRQRLAVRPGQLAGHGRDGGAHMAGDAQRMIEHRQPGDHAQQHRHVGVDGHPAVEAMVRMQAARAPERRGSAADAAVRHARPAVG